MSTVRLIDTMKTVNRMIIAWTTGRSPVAVALTKPMPSPGHAKTGSISAALPSCHPR